jgi:hypothetical protein
MIEPQIAEPGLRPQLCRLIGKGQAMKRIVIAGILMVCAAMGAEAKTHAHKHVGKHVSKSHSHEQKDGCALDRVVPDLPPGNS